MALALAAVLLLHALFVLALWYEMQPGPPHPPVAHVDRALLVRLIDRSSESRTAQTPEPPPLPTLPPRHTVPARAHPVSHEKSRHDAMVVQDHETPAPAASTGTPSAPHVFAKDGLIRMPATAPTYATTGAATKAAKPTDDRQIMQHDSNRLHYKATRFEKYFPPPNETAGGAVGRHVGDAIKAVAKSVCDPKRGGFNPLCGTPPVPPSPKDRDERLNLPPPPLAEDPHAAKPPPLSSCIAEYKANQPLSYGCPVNTPDLAFKAEMRECIDLFRAGKRLKTWCPLDTPKRAAIESSTPAASSSTDPH